MWLSNGSLPSGFLIRISKRQPLSAPSDVRRYFISLQESGQICMLACLLGKNREIFFPKLNESQMVTFDKIATRLLHTLGYEVLECISEQEAIIKAKKMCSGDKKYPVYYSESDTSGEKGYEEFFTEKEVIDLERMKSLGIIIEKKVPDTAKIELLLSRLDEEFEKEDTHKETIVNILNNYLTNFQHIELNKNLDSKM